MSRAYLTAGLLIAWLACCALSFAAGWSWRGDRAELAGTIAANAATQEALSGEQVARSVDRGQVNAVQRAADAADDRQEQIDAEYQTRIAAAAAGRDGELGRLRSHWASCETSRLADGAAAAAAAAEENRLRRVSAAGIVRACELAQSERDEAVDRYQAVETAINGAKRP